MAKRLKNFRLDDTTIDHLQALAAGERRSLTNMLDVLVDRAWKIRSAGSQQPERALEPEGVFHGNW